MTEAMDHESPGLEVFKPNFELNESTPPPFATQSQSPGSNGAKQQDKDPFNKSRQLHLQIGQAAATASLLQSSAPNNPEIWRYEKEYPLTVDPPVFGHGFHRALKPDSAKFSKKPELVKPDLIKVSEQALDLLPDAEGPQPPLGNKRTLPPPSELVEVSQAPRPPPNGQPRFERSPSSPLSKFLITAPESRDSLPKLRDPTRALSPVESSTRLPPIQTQLGPVLPPPNGPPLRPVGTPSYSIPPALPPSLPPVSAVSPPLTRVDPSPREPYRLAPLQPPPKIPPSPYSHLSPASSQAISAVSSPVSTQTYWRNSKPPPPYPYDPPSTASNRSPALNYPTPIERTSTVVGGCDPGGYAPSPQGTVPSGPTGTFKCSHPGCNAAPFQTQYLLNSHANVHSQDRPHFCPIEGCPRGPGGKGFKRKNEMIRHGLVHNSPGYVCPFCPEQQHKYPRPDNLQRHVRVHHVDKNKDDPALRHVLAQRPEGSGRGRRRRLNPQ
ncbi:uncharacterized protein BDV17DRAFT_290963 [Aspergillus undulatus]|uniref:uncharacterized protein n=1 Tax=Aspergillus undulatus TaxID=1810928 RepID=UPI003CCCA2DF